MKTPIVRETRRAGQVPTAQHSARPSTVTRAIAGPGASGPRAQDAGLEHRRAA